MRSFALLPLLVLVGCTGPIAGTRTRHPRPVPAGPPIATTLASDPAGLRVLVNANTGSGPAGLLATNPDEYAALWDELDLSSARPPIDFATHVVLGSHFSDGVCHPEIVAANIDAAGVLTFEHASLADACILLGAQTTTVVAVPRSLLPSRFTWRTAHGDFAFTLPPRAAIARHRALPIDTGARTSVAASRGTIELPAVGRIALRSLDDGRQVWVARRDASDISVLLADRPSRTRGVHHVIQWNDRTHRFSTGHDSRGRSVQGGPPLEVLAFTRLDGDRISIGDSISVAYAPPVPRDREPQLDGPAKPYADLAPVPVLRAIAENHFGLLGDSLVIGLDGRARFCTLPEGKARQFLPGCHPGHPTLVTHASDRDRRGVSMIHGPIVIRRTGESADLAIDLGVGQSGWTVERRLHEPAERGVPRKRGPLVVGVTATGTTGGFTQYNAPPECVPVPARGSPDDHWTFEVPRTAIYVFELNAKYDATLALVDAAGNTIACNDDANGFHRRSLINIELAANTKLAVIVDGFGGDRGAYALAIHEQPPLPRLVVGGSVTGDTTRAIDQESHGCHAPAGDHRIPLRIETAGRYAFRIDTPGWAPMISVFRAGGSEFGCYTHRPPLVDSHMMEPGEYFVVIDGSDTKQRGPYTLSAERCPTDNEKECESALRSR